MTKPKEAFNLFLNRQLVKQIRTASEVYGDRISLVMSAAAIMFLEAHPKVQGQYIEKVLMAEVQDQVAEMLIQVRSEQLSKVTAADKTQSSRSVDRK